MRTRIVGRAGWIAAWFVATTGLHAQTPQPFPRPGQPSPPAQQAPAPPPPTIQAPPPAPTQPQAPPAAAIDTGVPTAATLGAPIYPSAQFLTSYEAGRGQRFYLFGTTAPYLDIVAYYRTQLGNGGDTVFREPATHMFTTTRFRQETMAFPPGVTVKDWTWGGSQGYPNPKLGGEPARFPTVIMIVPPPPAPVAGGR